MSLLQRPALWLGIGLALHIAFLFALFGDWLRPFFNDASHTRRGFDFGVFYLAGQALAQHRDIYAVEGAFGYRYLPVFAQTFGRLYALVAPLPAYVLHLCIGELLLAANVWLTWRLCSQPLLRARAVCMWLSFSPYFLEMYIGQVSFWAASALYWLMAALRENRPYRQAAIWATSILIKPNMLILLPALLRMRYLRPTGLALAAAGLASLPYFLSYPNALTSFVQTNLQAGHFKGALTHAGNVGLWGSLVRMGAHFSNAPLSELTTLADLPLWAALPAYAMPALGSLAALYVSWRSRSDDPVLHLSLWMSTYFLVYKDVWEHHYVFLLPVIIALYMSRSDARLLGLYVALALPTPFILFDVQPGVYGPIDPERSWDMATSLIYRSAKLVPTLLLWVYVAQQLRSTEIKND